MNNSAPAPSKATSTGESPSLISPVVIYAIAGALAFSLGFLLWPYSIKDPEPIPKKRTAKEQISELIHSLSHCQPETEALLCQSLREYTGMNFGYELATTREAKRIALGQWIEWWRANQKYTKEKWLALAVADHKYLRREEALRELSKMKITPEIYPILKEIVNFPLYPSSIRAGAARLLGQEKVNDIHPRMVKLLKSPQVKLVLASLDYLGKLGQETPEIIPLLKHPDPRIRERAAQALYMISPPNSKPLLAPWLADKDLSVRHHALSALREICSSSELAKLIDKHVSNRQINQSLKKNLSQ